MKKGENTLILFGLSLVSRLPLVPLRFLIPVLMPVFWAIFDMRNAVT